MVCCIHTDNILDVWGWVGGGGWGGLCTSKPPFLHSAAGLEVGADALAGALLELGELAATGLDDGLDLLLGLFGDGHHAVQILVHEQTHKHLTEGRERGAVGGGGRGEEERM